MDIYHVDLKTKHIAHKVTLPKPSAAANENANRHGLPALLIINLMVPLYQVSRSHNLPDLTIPPCCTSPDSRGCAGKVLRTSRWGGVLPDLLL